jgi:hypothetical protein
MKWLALLLLTACAPVRQTVSLTPFPETHTDYRYFIRIPYATQSCIIRWYYLEERAENMIYASPIITPRTQTIETDMYFPWQGRYILTIYIVTPDGVTKQRHTYNARKMGQ